MISSLTISYFDVPYVDSKYLEYFSDIFLLLISNLTLLRSENMHFLRFILGPRIRPNLVKIWQFLAKLNTILPKDPAVTLLVIHPTDLKLMSENIYTPMFIVV